jgi:hypothetical protein
MAEALTTFAVTLFMVVLLAGSWGLATGLQRWYERHHSKKT